MTPTIASLRPVTTAVSEGNMALHGSVGTLPADTSLLVIFLVGLLGGAHCLGMCGPLVTLYADRMPDRKGITWYDIRQHSAFNLGRTIGYATVGALLGALGAVLFDAAAIIHPGNSIRAGAGILVGVLIVLVGLGYLTRGTAGIGHAPPILGSLFGRVHGLLARRVDSWVRGPRIVGLGMVHAALPCPLLYPAYLYAFAMGSPVVGAISLGVLGLGTFPTMLAYGAAFSSLSAGRRIQLHRALGAAFVLLGYIPLSHGLALIGIHVPHVDIPIFQPH